MRTTVALFLTMFAARFVAAEPHSQNYPQELPVIHVSPVVGSPAPQGCGRRSSPSTVESVVPSCWLPPCDVSDTRTRHPRNRVLLRQSLDAPCRVLCPPVPQRLSLRIPYSLGCVEGFSALWAAVPGGLAATIHAASLTSHLQLPAALLNHFSLPAARRRSRAACIVAGPP